MHTAPNMHCALLCACHQFHRKCATSCLLCGESGIMCFCCFLESSDAQFNMQFFNVFPTAALSWRRFVCFFVGNSPWDRSAEHHRGLRGTSTNHEARTALQSSCSVERRSSVSAFVSCRAHQLLLDWLEGQSTEAQKMRCCAKGSEPQECRMNVVSSRLQRESQRQQENQQHQQE